MLNSLEITVWKLKLNTLLLNMVNFKAKTNKTYETKKIVEAPKETPKESSPALNESMDQKAMSFFKSVDIAKGKAVVPLGNTGISLYDGLPWEANGKAYQLDNDKVNQYENKYLGESMKSSIVSDNNCSPKGLDSDGVVCADFAATPILGFCDIDEAGVPIGWTSSRRPKKVAAILKDSADKTYYLPLKCVGDAKGHAWPGGLAQTFLSTAKNKKGAWKFNSDGGYITGTIIGSTISDLSKIKSGYSTVKYNGAKVSVQLNLELNSAIKKLLKGYTLKGFVSWKE